MIITYVPVKTVCTEQVSIISWTSVVMGCAYMPVKTVCTEQVCIIKWTGV